MIEDYTAWKFWLDLAQLLGILAVGLYTWWSNREKVTDKKFTSLEGRVARTVSKLELEGAIASKEIMCGHHKKDTRRQETAIHALEAEIKALPTRLEVKELSTDMAGLTEKIGNLSGRLEGINRVADLMNEFLIKQGGKG